MRVKFFFAWIVPLEDVNEWKWKQRPNDKLLQQYEEKTVKWLKWKPHNDDSSYGGLCSAG